MDRYERKVVLIMALVFALSLFTMIKASGVVSVSSSLQDSIRNLPQQEAVSAE